MEQVVTMVSEDNKKEFSELGATVLRQFWTAAEISKIDEVIAEVGSSPGPMMDVFESDAAGQPLFYNDFNNWRRLKRLREVCLLPKLGEAFRLLSGSKKAYFFHDHVICKRKGASKATPWHLDKSYFMLDARCTASFWTPTTSLPASQTLKFACGSHQLRELKMSRAFIDGSGLESGDHFIQCSDQEIESEFRTIAWEIQAGDVIVFDFYVLHCVPAYVSEADRKALSLRIVGDDASFDGRVRNPTPPFTRMGYKAQHGDKIDSRWFPEYPPAK